MQDYMNKAYRLLMDKYQYSPNEIDEMDYFKMSDLLFTEIEEQTKQPLLYADEIIW